MVGYVMILSPQHQSWLFFLPLAQQSALLKDDLLDPVDQAQNEREAEKKPRSAVAIPGARPK